jgi:Skp family chaperone for outer membrane proteins
MIWGKITTSVHERTAMKGAAIAASLAVVLSAAPVFAQAAGQAPRPAAPAPASPAAAQPAPAAPPPPFPAGAKIAFVNLQQVANLSGEGKISTGKVQALMAKKQTEAQAKSKALADAQAKLQSSGGILSDAARAQLEKDIERMNVEGQRFQQDAQAEINELSQQLQNEFQQKLFPVLEAVSKEKGIQVLLSAADAGVVWAEAGLDLTLDAVKKLDAMAAAAKAAPAPAAAAPKPAASPAPAPAAPKP